MNKCTINYEILLRAMKSPCQLRCLLNGSLCTILNCNDTNPEVMTQIKHLEGSFLLYEIELSAVVSVHFAKKWNISVVFQWCLDKNSIFFRVGSCYTRIYLVLYILCSCVLFFSVVCMCLMWQCLVQLEGMYTSLFSSVLCLCDLHLVIVSLHKVRKSTTVSNYILP